MISALLDAWLLPLLVALPIVGALFVLAMPASDRLALRHVGMAVTIGAGLLALRAIFLAAGTETLSLESSALRLSLDARAFPALLAIGAAMPVALRAGAPRVVERTQAYVVLVLVHQACALAALLAVDPLVSIVAADVAMLPLLALVALHGGPLRGSTSFRTGILFFAVDSAAITALVWLGAQAGPGLDLRAAAAATSPSMQALLAFVVAGPGLLRVCAGPFSVWLAPLVDQAPVSSSSATVAVVMPLGAVMLVKGAPMILPGGVVTAMPAFLVVCVGGALVAGLVSLAERDLARLVAHACSATGALGALALVVLDAPAAAAALTLVAAYGLAAAFALTVIAAIERRVETRDSLELVGLVAELPLLVRLWLLAVACLVAVPAVGAGGPVWRVVLALAHAGAPAAAGVAPSWSLRAAALCMVGVVLVAVALGAAARRLLVKLPRKTAVLEGRMSAAQALRLWVPALFALIAGVLAPAAFDLSLAVLGPIVDDARSKLGDRAPAETRGPAYVIAAQPAPIAAPTAAPFEVPLEEAESP